MDYKIHMSIIDGRKTYWKDGDRCRVLSLHDTTADELFPYDSHCPLCWLGHGHSGDVHRHNLSVYAQPTASK